jgi:hypothetical protein
MLITFTSTVFAGIVEPSTAEAVKTLAPLGIPLNVADA